MSSEALHESELVRGNMQICIFYNPFLVCIDLVLGLATAFLHRGYFLDLGFVIFPYVGLENIKCIGSNSKYR